MTTRLWKGFCEIASALAQHGVPHPADAWMREVERFYTHPTATRWIACVGRGAGKNLVGIECDLTELVFGEWNVPAGERHYQVHVSENRTEAEKTLRQLAEYLTFLNVPHHATADTIDLGAELSDRGVKVLACRIGAVSGFRSIGLTTQECAKWNDDGMNPSEEVFISATAQTVTHPHARKRVFSTPMGRTGFFFDLLAQGDTADQIVTLGPSWRFNPSISEAHTRSLTTSERQWLREYAAEPSAGADAAFDADAIERAFVRRQRADSDVLGTPVLIVDPSSGKKDTWAYAIARWVMPKGGRRYLRFEHVDGVGGSFWKSLGADKIVERTAQAARAFRCSFVHSDQRESFLLRAEYQRHNLIFQEHPWTAASKPRGIEGVRRWLADGILDVSVATKVPLRAELLGFEERITASGAFTFGARGGAHDDFVALLITAALADEAHGIPHHDMGAPENMPSIVRAPGLSSWGGGVGGAVGSVFGRGNGGGVIPPHWDKPDPHAPAPRIDTGPTPVVIPATGPHDVPQVINPGGNRGWGR
jgi:hypothetical protein